jgi:hypothetical protein
MRDQLLADLYANGPTVLARLTGGVFAVPTHYGHSAVYTELVAMESAGLVQRYQDRGVSYWCLSPACLRSMRVEALCEAVASPLLTVAALVGSLLAVLACVRGSGLALGIACGLVFGILGLRVAARILRRRFGAGRGGL